MERLSQNSEVTYHGHVVDKQPGQGVDPDLMTDTMSSAFFYPMATFPVPWRESKPGRINYNNSSKINN